MLFVYKTFHSEVNDLSVKWCCLLKITWKKKYKFNFVMLKKIHIFFYEWNFLSLNHEPINENVRSGKKKTKVPIVLSGMKPTDSKKNFMGCNSEMDLTRSTRSRANLWALILLKYKYTQHIASLFNMRHIA